MPDQDVMTLTERVEAIHRLLNYLECKSLNTAMTAIYAVEQDADYGFVSHVNAAFQGFKISVYVGPSLIIGESETDIEMYNEVHEEIIAMFDRLGFPYSQIPLSKLETDAHRIKVH